MEGVTNAKGSKRFPKEPGRMAERCPGVERDENQNWLTGFVSRTEAAAWPRAV